MAISRTPKNKSDETSDQNFFSQPTAEIFDDVDHEHDGKSESGQQDDKYEKLAQQIADLAKQNEELRNSQMQLLSTPAWKPQSETFTPADPMKIELPDPALDPNGYDAAVARRNEIRDSNRQRQNDINQRNQNEMAEKVEDLWSAFSDKYPDMSGDKERIDFVATQVSKRAQKRGMDVTRYMFTTQDRYLDDVAKEYVKVFGEPEVDNNDDNYDDNSRNRRSASRDDARPRARNRNRQEEDYGRTGGVFGGNESGGRPSGRRQRDDDETGPSMIDDLQVLQKKTGFY